jgi:hypothetical protein
VRVNYEEIPAKKGFIYGLDTVLGSNHNILLNEVNARDAIF